ncbi:MAG: MBL fold metallo-hydrolase [Bacteroidales bacterium]|nr:MBL fold metallo-hydrolase [Bacteroidales bacterium]
MLEQNKNNLEYKRFIFNELGVNAFVLYDDTREAVIVDGAAENEKQSNELLKFIEEKNLKVKYIISTHGHFDHIYGNSKLLEKFKVPLLMHKDDNIWIENFQQITARYGMKTDKAPLPTKTIDEGDTIKFGNSELLVFHVPGHSAGSIVLYAKEINLLISGDTLFEDSIGRTDLEGGDYNTLIKNIKEKILVLPPNTIVFPGHGNSTTVEYESKNNPYLK